MGFSWTAINIGDEITAAVIAEMRTHLNTLYGNLDLDEYSWTIIPVQNQIIPATQYTEFKTATDNAEDQNYCRTHNATHDSGYNVTHDTTLYADHDSGHLNDHNTGHNVTHDSSVNSSQYSGYLGGYYISNLSSTYSSVNTGKDTSYCVGYYTGVI